MFKYIALITAFLCLSLPAQATWQQLPHIYYVSIPVTSNGEQMNISAQYRLPRNQTEAVPAVVILHSSGGIDSTGQYYAKALNNAGIATLELDMWGGRNLLGGTVQRPATVQETIPDAYAALAFLAEKAEIDENNIAILGFSWGGVVSLLTSTQQYAAPAEMPYSFAAHIAHYPVCWAYNRLPGFEFANLTGAPVLIQAAELDDYDLPTSCQELVNGLNESDGELVDLNFYRGAYHAWDRFEPKLVVEDVFANHGQGGLVTLKPHFWSALKSKRAVLSFVDKAFND